MKINAYLCGTIINNIGGHNYDSNNSAQSKESEVF